MKLLASSLQLLACLVLAACQTAAPNRSADQQSAAVEPSRTQREPEEEYNPPPPRPFKFITLTWDPHDPADQVIGYRLYMGEQPGNYAGSVTLDLVHYLHNRCELPVLINHPVTFFAVAAINAIAEGPPSDELRYDYPELQHWLALSQ